MKLQIACMPQEHFFKDTQLYLQPKSYSGLFPDRPSIDGKYMISDAYCNHAYCNYTVADGFEEMPKNPCKHKWVEWTYCNS